VTYWVEPDEQDAEKHAQIHRESVLGADSRTSRTASLLIRHLIVLGLGLVHYDGSETARFFEEQQWLNQQARF